MAKILRPNGINRVNKQYQQKLFLLIVDLAVGMMAAGWLLNEKQWIFSGICAAVSIFIGYQLYRSSQILKSGAQGESKTLRMLKKRLPGNYTVVADLELNHQGHRSQLDYAVVTDGKVYIVECKNVSGQISGNSSANSLNQTKYRGGQIVEKKTMYNPVLQVEGHAKTLRGILGDKGLSAQVTPVVYFANPNAKRKMDFLNHRVFFQSEGGEDGMIHFLTSSSGKRGKSSAKELIKEILEKNVAEG